MQKLLSTDIRILYIYTNSNGMQNYRNEKKRRENWKKMKRTFSFRKFHLENNHRIAALPLSATERYVIWKNQFPWRQQFSSGYLLIHFALYCCCTFLLQFYSIVFTLLLRKYFCGKKSSFWLVFCISGCQFSKLFVFFSLNLRVRIQRTSKMPIRMFLFSSNFIDFVTFVCMQFRSFYIRLIYEFSLCSVDSTNCAKIKCFLTKTGKQHNFFNGLLSKNRFEWKKEWKNTDSQVLANTRWQKNTWNRAAE